MKKSIKHATLNPVMPFLEDLNIALERKSGRANQQ